VEVYIEINTVQARLVESMLISLREHLYVLFPKMDKQEKLGTQSEDKQSKNTTRYVFNSTRYIQKQLEIKTNHSSFLCGNRNRHHNMELRT
jgi:hypothetical protein